MLSYTFKALSKSVQSPPSQVFLGREMRGNKQALQTTDGNSRTQRNELRLWQWRDLLKVTHAECSTENSTHIHLDPTLGFFPTTPRSPFLTLMERGWTVLILSRISETNAETL